MSATSQTRRNGDAIAPGLDVNTPSAKSSGTRSPPSFQCSFPTFSLSSESSLLVRSKMHTIHCDSPFQAYRSVIVSRREPAFAEASDFWFSKELMTLKWLS